jgi:hypothetical protein
MGYNRTGRRSKIVHCVLCDRPFRARYCDRLRGQGYYCSWQCFCRVHGFLRRALRTGEPRELFEILRRLA